MTTMIVKIYKQIEHMLRPSLLANWPCGCSVLAAVLLS